MLALALALGCSYDAVAWPSPAPALGLDVDVVTFAAVPVGAASSHALVLRNDGDAPGRFSLATDPPFLVSVGALELDAGATAVVTLGFAPSDWVEAVGELRVDGAARVALSGPVLTDADGDGAASEAAGGDDCDDDDPTVHPDADDPCGDTLDADCSPEGDDDCDGDGGPVGADCDDADPAAFPGATETGPDGRDEDCDGRVDEVLARPGELVVTEVAPLSPSWVELCNVSDRAVELAGFSLGSTAGTAALPAGSVAPGACVAVCASRVAGCALTAAIEVGPVDTVTVVVEDVVLDTVTIDASWGWDAAWVRSLDAGAVAADQNDVPAAWCATTGSPGAANEACP